MPSYEYERVCPVKFWYYNNLITNQQNTLIIDKQKHRQMKSENLSKQCAKSRTLNNEINQKLSHFIQRRQRAI